MVILYTDLKSFCLKKVKDFSLKNIRHKKRDLIIRSLFCILLNFFSWKVRKLQRNCQFF